MRVLNKLFEIIDRWNAPLWPEAKPLPPHVQAVKINQAFMILHMREAEKPTRRDGFKYEP